MRTIRKVVSLLMCLLLCLSISVEAHATVENKVRVFTFSQEDLEATVDMEQMQRGNELICLMTIFITDVNTVAVTMSTSTGPVSSEIGVKDFVFQKKGWLFWSDMYSDSFCDYNTDFFVGTVEYTEPQSGKKYRAIGTHYAIIDGTEYTHIMISDVLEY